MLKFVCAAVVLLVEIAASHAAGEPWREKALELTRAEAKVRDAMWSQDLSYWISVDDDGSDRSGFAEYFCMVLNDAGRPAGETVIVSIWDHAAILKSDLRKLGSATCQ